MYFLVGYYVRRGSTGPFVDRETRKCSESVCVNCVGQLLNWLVSSSCHHFKHLNNINWFVSSGDHAVGCPFTGFILSEFGYHILETCMCRSNIAPRRIRFQKDPLRRNRGDNLTTNFALTLQDDKI